MSRTISDLQRLRSPVSSKPHPLQSDRENHRVRSRRRSRGGIDSGGRGGRALRWRMAVVLKQPRLGSSVGCHGICGRESSLVYYLEPVYGRDLRSSRSKFKVQASAPGQRAVRFGDGGCVISVRVGPDVDYEASLSLSNTRTTRTDRPGQRTGCRVEVGEAGRREE